MRYKLVAWGPSLVDVNITVSNDAFQTICSVYNINAGDWRSLSSVSDLNAILAIIGLGNVDIVFKEHSDKINMVAGSSTLCMLSSMPDFLRAESVYMSSLATYNGNLTPLSSFFNKAVIERGIKHVFVEEEGDSPMGLVLSSDSQPEKILFYYPGVSKLFNSKTLDVYNSDLIIIDCYELISGELASYLDQVIVSNKYRVALSLGNHTILQGELLEKVRKYIFDRRITAVSGNILEYKTLFWELPENVTTPTGFSKHIIKEYVDYALLTLGEDGMVAWSDGEFATVKAFYINPKDIVSTSGAGDVAAGVFYSGIVGNLNINDTLLKAAKLSTEVLKVSSSMIIGY